MSLRRNILAIGFLYFAVSRLYGQDPTKPDTVLVHSGELTLKGLLWHPVGKGKFPAIIFCHGSAGGTDTVHDVVHDASLLGPIFAARGYIYLSVFRRGAGLSKGQGINSTDLMDDAFKKKGQEARNIVQLQQMETDQMEDVVSTIAFLQNIGEADKNRIAIVGHSFGASLALLVAERRPDLKAVVAFSPGGYSWNLSPQLRGALLNAVKEIAAPIMIIHAENDYSTNPGHSLDSLLNQLHKPHVLKLYPKFGDTPAHGHGLIYESIDTWTDDVFKFLDAILK